jgi:hypothetical protein
MSRGKKNRQLPDLSMSVEEWESIKGRAASRLSARVASPAAPPLPQAGVHFPLATAGATAP